MGGKVRANGFRRVRFTPALPETLSHDKEAGTVIEYTRIKIITAAPIGTGAIG